MNRSPLLLGAVTLLAACRDPPRAWEHDDHALAPAPVVSVRYQAAPSDAGLDFAGDASLLAEAGSLLATDGGDLEGPLEAPVRVGGPWVRCYGNFKPSGEPVKDVTRLALLCGPENGMRRFGDRTIEGSVTEGGAPATSTFTGKRGECYRIFAVAEKSVIDLDVTVETTHGIAIAADHGEDGWPIVQPDRPFCPLDDDTYTVLVTARRGSGHFAAEIWRLRTPPR